jgi:hypothetical protein
MKHRKLSLAAAALTASVAAGQASVNTVAPGDQAVDWIPDGSTVLVAGPSNWATVDVATGNRTPIPAGSEGAVAIAGQGQLLGVMNDPVSGNNGTGFMIPGLDLWVYLGNMPGVTAGCPDLTNPYDLDDQGLVAVGLGWDGCAAHAYKWTSGVMAWLPQLGLDSSRANVVSADGSTVGGWDEDSPGQRRASVWYPDGTELLVNTTAANPTGFGEVFGLSRNGQWACGSGANGVGPFLYSQGTGTIELGFPPGGTTSGTTAFSVSDDGRVVVGNQGNFLGSRAWIWTSTGGMEWLDTYLAARGATLPGNLATAIEISPDGTKILGTWDTGGFPSSKSAYIAEIPPQPTWAQYGVGASSVNVLDLDGGGSTGLGQIFQPTVSNLSPASVFAASGISLTQASLPLLGGIVLINPAPLATVVGLHGGGGSVTHAIPVPPTTSLWGVTVFMQSLADDAAQPLGWALSNGLSVSL